MTNTFDDLVRAIVDEELAARAEPSPAGAIAYSVDEVASLLSCSRRHVYDHLIGTGRLRKLKVGRRVLIPAADVAALMEDAS